MSFNVKVTALAGAAMLACMSAASAAEFEIRGSHSESVESPLHKGWLVFEAYVESASGGRIAVDISPAGQLGGIKDGLEQAKVGAIQMAHGDEQTLDSFYKPMLILATPYLFASDEEAQRFLRSDFFMGVREQMAKDSGLRLLAAASYGFRCFTNNVKPIKSAADMAGIRMRVPPSPMSPAKTSSSESGIWARLTRPCAGCSPPNRPSAMTKPRPKLSWVFCSAQPPSAVLSSTARRGIAISRPA